MNEKDLNIEYICDKTLLNKDDELVPIILDLIQESYKAGLCQAEFDNTMNLIEENQELKQKYLNSVADYETAMAEKSELKKQVETYEIEGYEQNKELNKMSFDIKKYKTQQKEFIKWLEDMLEDENDIFSVVRVKDVLQKYKEMIGGKDENK